MNWPKPKEHPMQAELRNATNHPIEYSCEITADSVRVTATHLPSGANMWMEACLSPDECDAEILIDLAADARLDLIDDMTKTCRWCDAGEPCRKAVKYCHRMRASARDAGIPADVIDGKRKLNAPPPEDSEQYRKDMIDAGRGRLLR